jgi:hypothetical protein
LLSFVGNVPVSLPSPRVPAPVIRYNDILPFNNGSRPYKSFADMRPRLLISRFFMYSAISTLILYLLAHLQNCLVNIILYLFSPRLELVLTEA